MDSIKDPAVNNLILLHYPTRGLERRLGLLKILYVDILDLNGATYVDESINYEPIDDVK